MAFWGSSRCPSCLKMDPRISKMTPRDTKKALKTPHRMSRRSLRVPKDTPKGSMLSQWPPRLILIWSFVVFCRIWDTFCICTVRYIDRWIDTQMDRWMDGWIDRWIDRWIYR